MSLDIYAKYTQDNQTVIAIKESDPSLNVRFDAIVSGNHLDKSNLELLKIAIEWFTVKYIQEYAAQQNTVRLTHVEEDLQKKSEELTTMIKQAEVLKTRLEELSRLNELAVASTGEITMILLNSGLLTLQDDGNTVVHPSIAKIIENDELATGEGSGVIGD